MSLTTLINDMRADDELRAMVDRTWSALDRDPLRRYVVRFVGIDCDFHEWARSKQEAIDNAARVAVSNPNLRRSLVVERVEVSA